MRAVVLVGALVVVLNPIAAIAASCEGLSTLTLKNATIEHAQVVGAGQFTPPATGRNTAAAPYSDLSSFCRVAVTLKPTADSNIQMEIWMPVANWNGKFDALGGQGWVGSINYAGLRDGVARGYATASNDSGHVGGTGRFALDHPEQLIDFAYRSAHEMTAAGKTIITAFYTTSARRSYFDGCSTGGRMALTEAQRFPNDFDGIIAGAPANFSSHQAAQMLSVARAVHADDASFIPPAKFPLIHAAALQACDASDGLKDGVISNPIECSFDPKVLQCAGQDGPTCLTAPQVAAARQIYAPLVNPRTKQTIFPGLLPGSELGWGLLAGPQPQSFPLEIYQDIVFRNPDWNYLMLDFDKDVARAEHAYDGIMDAIDPDLRPFFRHGGKLLQYHGWSDQAVAPKNSVNYYESVLMKLSDMRVDDSYRLFMVPGMGHCTGGEGTSSFDMLAALDRWVEDGHAPTSIAAARKRNGAVDRTRPLCPYPQDAVYTGSGSSDDAANFVCKAQ